MSNDGDETGTAQLVVTDTCFLNTPHRDLGKNFCMHVMHVACADAPSNTGPSSQEELPGLPNNWLRTRVRLAMSSDAGGGDGGRGAGGRGGAGGGEGGAGGGEGLGGGGGGLGASVQKMTPDRRADGALYPKPMP